MAKKKKDKSSNKKDKSSKKKTSEKEKKQKVCEIFEVEKDGKEKTVEKCGTETTKIASKDQIEHQNKLLKNIFIMLGAVALIVALIILVVYSMYHFEYNGINFKIINEKTVKFYHTSFPSPFVKPGSTVEYNIYLRTDPRTNKVPFDGNLMLLEMAVIDSKEEFNCNGDGVIAIANFNQVMGAMGTEVIRDPEAECDSQGRYMHFNLKSGEESKIVQTGPACYDFVVSDCEILDVTEKFLVRALSVIN